MKSFEDQCLNILLRIFSKFLWFGSRDIITSLIQKVQLLMVGAENLKHLQINSRYGRT